MTIGQTVKARFEIIPSLLETGHPTKDQLYPIRTGEVVFIHPKGRFITVRTHTKGGDIAENFLPGEVMA